MQPMLTSHTGGQEVHLRVPVDVTSDGGPLPGLLMAAFWFSPQLAERERERGHKLFGDFDKGMDPIMGSTLMTSLNFNYLPKAPPPNTTHWRLGPSTYELQGDTSIWSIATSLCPDPPQAPVKGRSRMSNVPSWSQI